MRDKLQESATGYTKPFKLKGSPVQAPAPWVPCSTWPAVVGVQFARSNTGKLLYYGLRLITTFYLINKINRIIYDLLLTMLTYLIR